jgi:hypothetical protein
MRKQDEQDAASAMASLVKLPTVNYPYQFPVIPSADIQQQPEHVQPPVKIQPPPSITENKAGTQDAEEGRTATLRKQKLLPVNIQHTKTAQVAKKQKVVSRQEQGNTKKDDKGKKGSKQKQSSEGICTAGKSCHNPSGEGMVILLGKKCNGVECFICK